MQLVWFLLIGALAGWLAGVVTKGRGFGALGNVIVGVLGALLGGFLFRAVGLSASPNSIGELFMAFVGAIVLLFLISLIPRKP